jgi:hypothetical protein
MAESASQTKPNPVVFFDIALGGEYAKEERHVEALGTTSCELASGKS